MIENPSAPLDGENDMLFFERLQEHALAPYPNPERKGCPDPAVLKSLIDDPGDITLQGSLLREDNRIGTRSKLFKACATARVNTVMAIEINGGTFQGMPGLVKDKLGDLDYAGRVTWLKHRFEFFPWLPFAHSLLSTAGASTCGCAP